MNSICLIPARGGSKRIPRKNIKSFYGKPLITWSIECAKSSGIFNKIYVSTDDKEIASIANSCGANIPFLRPKEISDDKSTDEDVRNHFLNWYERNNKKVDLLCYLYPTAPFISPKTLKECKRILIEENVYSVLTISKYSYSPLRSLKINKEKKLSFNWPKYRKFRSQELPDLYHDAGQCYFYNYGNKKQPKELMGYEIPQILNQDIDTFEDFENAELKFEILIKKGLIYNNFS